MLDGKMFFGLTGTPMRNRVLANIKFADAELIGIPYRITIGPKSLADGEVEWSSRSTGETKRIGLTAAVDTVADVINAERVA